MNPVRTSQETHCFSATETNRLMPLGETVAVYCENYTEHTDTVRISKETHHVSDTEPNRLMLLGETVASPYLIRNTSRLRCRDQPVNAV
jgi:hypothetical protein